MQIILSQILQPVEGVHGVNLIILELHILKQGYKSECWLIISDAASTIGYIPSCHNCEPATELQYCPITYPIVFPVDIEYTTP